MDLTVALATLFGILISIIGFFMKSLYTRLEKVEFQLNEFKFNYLDRFKSISKEINDIGNKINETLSTIKTDIAKLQTRDEINNHNQ